MVGGLNLGSGQRRFPGWVNLDYISRPPDQIPDVVALGDRLPFRDDTFDVVCLHHVLEHFGCHEGDGLLKEAWRVLQVGGRLLIFVPNLRALARRWLQGRLPTQVYLTNLYGAYQGEEGDRHKWGYDVSSLCLVLRDLLGVEATLYDWRGAPSGANIAEDWWILGVEAVKV